MPTVVPAIKETVTMPVLPDVHPVKLVPQGKLPRSVVNVTEVPLGARLPELSVTVAVIIVELKPSAGILVGLAVSVIETPNSSNPPPQETRRDKAQII